jgi:Domain of unknown function (DUF1772)
MALKVLIILLSLFVSGLLDGNELAVAVFIHPVLYSVSDEAHVRVAKPLARRLGHSMPFWYALSLVFAILQMLIMRAPPAARWLCCAAAILLALIIVVTILLPAAINNRIARWDIESIANRLAVHAPMLGSVSSASGSCCLWLCRSC